MGLNNPTSSKPWYWNPPAANSFAKVSGDATQVTLTDDTDEGLLFDGGASVNGNVMRLCERTIANPNADWSITANLDATNTSTATGGAFGIAIRNSGNAKVLTYMSSQGSQLQLNRFTNLSTFSATVNTKTFTSNKPKWIRVTFTFATLTFNFYASMNGKNWMFLYSETVGNFIAANPDKISIGVLYNRTNDIIVGQVQALTITP